MSQDKNRKAPAITTVIKFYECTLQHKESRTLMYIGLPTHIKLNLLAIKKELENGRSTAVMLSGLLLLKQRDHVGCKFGQHIISQVIPLDPNT